MNFTKALRISPTQTVAFVGAGGKTTAMFALAREIAPCIVTTTTHLGAWQARLANQHLVVESQRENDFTARMAATDWAAGITLISGPEHNERLSTPSQSLLARLHTFCREQGLPLLIEADGARQKPLKAPAAHEPVVPAWADYAVVVAGLSGLGQPLDENSVHRANIFFHLANLPAQTAEALITTDMLRNVLTHPQGGLKGLPTGAHRVALLNQADDDLTQAIAGRLASTLLQTYETALVAGKVGANWQVTGARKHTAGIILAAGSAVRYGRTKQLLDYGGQPFVRVVAETALRAGLSPVIVVCGAAGQHVAAAVTGLNVQVIHNPHWQSGQASSIRAGLSILPPQTGAAVFLLADQPQVTVEVIRALVERHTQTQDAVLAPYVFDRRANPVLFDQMTFEALSQLSGDVGGRGIFSRFSPRYVNWYDKHLLIDVDTPQDYAKLLNCHG